jgi:hypothetical protein
VAFARLCALTLVQRTGPPSPHPRANYNEQVKRHDQQFAA